jgi:hypothetical protein
VEKLEIIMKKTLLLFLLFSFLPFCLTAQEGKWVETEGDCFITNITREEAFEKALTKAELKALEVAVGTQVTGLTFRSVSETMVGSNVNEFEDHFTTFNLLLSNGKIVKRNINTIFTVENEQPKVIVKLRALVVPIEGNPDPAFRAEIVMDKGYYLDRNPKMGVGGEEVKFKLRATQDCYFYLFNLMSYDSVQLILPNKYIKDNKFVYGKEEQDFERQIKSMNLKFYADIPEGKTETWEGFLLIALKEKIDFTSSNFLSDENNIIPTYKAAFEDLMQWLIKIPVDKRTEDLKKFKIILSKR